MAGRGVSGVVRVNVSVARAMSPGAGTAWLGLTANAPLPVTALPSTVAVASTSQKPALSKPAWAAYRPRVSDERTTWTSAGGGDGTTDPWIGRNDALTTGPNGDGSAPPSLVPT
jgi:hypothetical protein